jgi:hypothetical protein|tara:strand:- start:1634 stop:1969 length:336 start_codon:yes stop_codon:yes gene_type:complete
MLILTTSAASQDFYIIPRQYSGDEIIVTDQETNTSTTYAVFTQTINEYYLTIGLTFSPVLQEGHFYSIEVNNAGENVYRDMIFCTDQVPSEYTINDGVFDEYESTNQYIVL